MKTLIKSLDVIPSACAVIDSDGIILSGNQQLMRLFEGTKTSIIDQHITKTVAHLDTARFRDKLEFQLTSGRSIIDMPPEIYSAVTCRNVKINVSVKAGLFEQAGESYLIASFEPVSADFALARLFELTQSIARIGSWRVDLADETCQWSDMVYEIHEVDQSVEINLAGGIKYYAPEHRPIIEKCIQASIDTGQPWDVELKIITTSGRQTWVNAIGAAVFVDGKVVGLEGTFQDIDQRKLLELERENLVQQLSLAEHIAKIGHWEWQLDSERMEWSQEMFEIFGVEADLQTILLQDLRKYIFNEDYSHLSLSIEDAVSAVKPFSTETRIVIQGSIKFIRIDARPKFSPGGVLTGFFGTAQDISQIKDSQQKYLDQSSRLTLAMRAANAGVWEWDLLTDRLVWDAQMLRLYNINQDDFTGAYSSWEKGLHPEDRDSQSLLIKKSIDELVPFDNSFRVVWDNGEVRHIRALADVILDSAGKPVKMIGVNWDITEDKNQQLALQASNERYELMLQGTSVGVRDWPDINSPTEYWSPKFYELLGYKNNEIDASWTSFNDLLHPDDTAATFAAIDAHFKNGAQFQLNYRLKTKAGEYRWFMGAGQVARDSEGKPVRMVGTIQDIHEQKLAENNLTRMNHELQQISYRTSHDLKAPLTTTKRLAHYIAKDIESGELAEAKLNVIKIGKQMEKLEDLVSGILSLAQSDLSSTEQEAVDFDAIAREIDSNLEYLSFDAKYEIIWQVDVKEDFIGQKVRFVQVIENLVSNGIKYRNFESKTNFVKITIADDAENLVIEVKDNGIGIPKRFHAELFDMFKRFHPSVAEGSGLGLSIVKKHVDSLNGSIEVESDEQGTMFSITIPKNHTQKL